MKITEVDFLRIISADKKVFIVSINAVVLCPGLLKMVEHASLAEERVAETASSFPSRILKTVIEYVFYKMRYMSQEDYQSLPPFKIMPNQALEVFKAARELGI